MSGFKFWLNPKHWLLSGRDLEIARARAACDGSYEAEIKLAEVSIENPVAREMRKLEIAFSHGKISSLELEAKNIELTVLDPKERAIRLAKLNLIHKTISEYEYQKQMLELDLTGYELDKAVADLDLKHGKLTEEQHFERQLEIDGLPEMEKQIMRARRAFKLGEITELECSKRIATYKGEPWVEVLSMDINSENVGEGSFSLDWNSHFVEKLHDAGYLAPTEEQTVQLWFNEICKNIAIEAFDGVGDFNERIGPNKQQ